MKIVVNNDGARLDVFLSNNLKITRNKSLKLIKESLVLVNDRIITKAGYILKVNDQIFIIEKPNEESNKKIKYEKFKYKLKIIYEDEYLMIVYKPSNMLSHQTIFKEKNCLYNALEYYFEQKQINQKPLLVHRLDKDTSGLVLVAKEDKTLLELQKLFEERKIIKKYYAIVHNQFNEEKIIINVPIARSRSNKLKMIATEKGKNVKFAITEVSLIKNFKHFALIDVLLKTGRTHQIRVHLKYINHSILNDPLYGVDKDTTSYGQFLMAYYLEFEHPITKQKIVKKIEMDKEFVDIIKKLEKY